MIKRVMFVLLLLASISSSSYALMVWDYPDRNNDSHGTPHVSASSMNNSAIDGGFIQARMGDIETADGTYDWSKVQADVATIKTAGKVYELDLYVAWTEPAWLKKLVPQFTWVWDQTWGLPICSTASAPQFWDSTYQDKYEAFLAEAAAKYANDPSLYAIKVNAFGNETDEYQLQRNTAPRAINHGQCYSKNDVTDWTAAGYTVTKVTNSALALFQAIKTYFPQQQHDLMIVPNGFPLDQSGNNLAWDTIEEDLIESAATAQLNLKVQNNGWSNAWGFVSKNSPYTVSIWQETGRLGSNFSAAASLAESTPDVLEAEIYESDITSAHQSALTQLHNADH